MTLSIRIILGICCAVLIFVLLMGTLIGSIYQLNSSHTVYGTTTVVNSWTGDTDTYFNLTVSYQGQIYHATVACNLYPTGSPFPLQQASQFLWLPPFVNLNTNWLPRGC